MRARLEWAAAARGQEIGFARNVHSLGLAGLPDLPDLRTLLECKLLCSKAGERASGQLTSGALPRDAHQ